MPSSVFVGGILMSVRTMSGDVRSTASRSSSRSPRHLDQLDVLDIAEDADDPLPGEEAVLGGDDPDRHLATSLVTLHIPRKRWCPHHEGSGAAATVESANPPMPPGLLAGILTSEGVATSVHDGRGDGMAN